MPRRLRLPAVLLAAVVVAQVVTVAMRPREEAPTPASVSPRAYFTQAQIDRAQGFRRPQVALYGLTVLIGLGAGVLLVRRPPRWARGSPRRPVLAGAAAAATVSAVTALAPLPVAAASRQRAVDVGLSTRSWPGWAWDVLLGTAISAGFAALGGALLVVGLRRLGRRWWAAGAAAVVAFGVAITLLSPVLVEPLFNRFTPLPEGPTRAAVLDLARRAEVDVGEVYVVDASKRTTGANAYVAGLGRTKRVVIYDTLLRDFPPAEVRSVVAHELGHVHYADVSHGLLWVAVVAPFGMLAVARLAEAFGPEDWRVRPAAAVPAVALAVALVVPVLTTISNQLSRQVEARADRYALELTGQADPLIAFERRITVRNVSDPAPPGWQTALLATHPPTMQRIGAAIVFRREEARRAAQGAARSHPTPGGS